MNIDELEKLATSLGEEPRGLTLRISGDVVLASLSPRKSKATARHCVICGRTDTRGFSRLLTRRVHFENGQRTQLPTRATWVCRRGFGCEGVGSLHVAFFHHPNSEGDTSNA